MNEDIGRNFLDDFYTPDDIASPIANWLIRSGDEIVLEPTAGGGALISAAIKRGKELSPYKNLNFLGFDIDRKSIDKLKEFESDFLKVYQKNFLDTVVNDYFEVDAVLANPPFSRNQNIDKKYREELRKRFGVKGSVGVWGFFLLHSLSYLRLGGRLACIVPKSVCFTMHGKQFLNRLASHFNSIGIYEFQSKPKWSRAALENGAVILADNYKMGKAKKVSYGILENNGKTLDKVELGNGYYKEILSVSNGLESLADVSIGLVTGRNKVFLLSKKEVLANNISEEELLPTLSRRRHLNGIFFNKEDFLSLDNKNEKYGL
ncbi:N-6 DNA methylase [Halomonas sp. HNIBRBA4712]|uniref:N-6 DNA methylase n=1 Tax=Halomonas sp. HNIBRBA4712 TaxID=3373087 RepID=UPI0037465BF5